MKNRAIIFWLAILFLFSGTMIVWMGWRKYSEATAIPPSRSRDNKVPRRLDELILTDQYGEPFSIEQLRGKVWIASFFYTSCPSVCRMQNTQVAQLQRDFPSDELHFVSITCDPARDTPAVLARYAEIFNADSKRWHFLTGDLEYIKQLGPVLQTSVEEEVHSDRLFVIDRDTTLRGGFRSTEPLQLDQLKKLVTGLLASTDGESR